MTANILDKFLNESIHDLKNRGLYNEIDTVEGANGPIIRIDGQELINLSSNNYLGLATDERLKKAAKEAIDLYGVGAGAVRTINGTLTCHKELEEKIALFKGTEAAIAFQSGFNSNIATIPSIVGRKDAILSDALNHASIIDGCRLSRAKIIPFEHSNMDHLRQKAKEAVKSGQYEKIMVITDGVFSMDGDIAKLPEIIEIAEEFGFITYVDDAHGSGVLGNGAGTVKHFGLEEKVDIQMGTLSKAIGVVGGYVAGRKKLIEWLKVQARPFLFSTSVTPADAVASQRAIEILMVGTDRYEQLWENGRYLKEQLQKLGFNIGNSETPITPCIIGDEKKTQEFSDKLRENGVYAKSIVFPTVPRGTGRIRNMPIAIHTKEMLDQAISVYELVGKEMKIIK